MEYYFNPQGVCSQQMVIRLKEDEVEQVTIVGGCAGNSLGVSKLVQGMNIDEAIQKLKGILCGRRGTSCPDQLAIALEEAKRQIIQGKERD